MKRIFNAYRDAFWAKQHHVTFFVNTITKDIKAQMDKSNFDVYIEMRDDYTMPQTANIWYADYKIGNLCLVYNGGNKLEIASCEIYSFYTHQFSKQNDINAYLKKYEGVDLCPPRVKAVRKSQ